MQPRFRRMPAIGLAAAALLASLLASLALAPVTSAHSGIEIGEYLVEVGWKAEPAFVGQPNAVQIVVRDHHDESPILAGVQLGVIVSTADKSSAELELVPAFDAVERTGSLGEYDAPLVPTAPGDYTFQLVGKIADTDVDVSLTSGEATFDAVQGSSDLEFPVALPNLNEVATRLDRIDARIAALQSADPGSAALDAAEAAADAARLASASADRALMIGSLVGGAGVLLAVVALAVALRTGRRGAGTA